MKNTNISATLKELISTKGGPCVSLIIPLHDLPGEKAQDQLSLVHAMEKLRSQLNEKDETHAGVLTKVKMLAEQARNINGENGVGIYASPGIARLATFPFEVQEKVYVNNSFDIRDLVQKERYTREYFVLLLGGNGTRLFKAKENKLREYTDNNFPVTSKEREYATVLSNNNVSNAVGTLSPEKKPSAVSITEVQNLVDEKLQNYLTDVSTLILAGPEKEVSLFMNNSIHASKIKGRVQGSYSDFNFEELATKCWQAFKLDQKNEEKDLLLRLKEMSPQFVSSGITEVWRDARQGRGNILLVEKSLDVPVYAGENDFIVELSPSRHDQPLIVNAVGEIVETVIEKNGRVIFVEDGLLKDYQRIVMMNRY